MQVMKMKYAAGFALLAVVLAVGWYFWGSRRAPRGQPPLTSLTSANFEQFKSEFNNASDCARLVLLLSPT
jgi:hypothetical protein